MPTLLEFPIVQPLPITGSTGAVPYLPQQEQDEQKELVPEELQIGRPRQRILQALSVFPALTAEQLARYLGYSLRYVQQHLQYLVQIKFVRVILPENRIRYGRVPFVYTLTSASTAYLKELGHPVAERIRPKKETAHKGKPHSLAVNEVLLKATLLAQDHPDITLKDHVHERVLNAKPLKVVIPGEEKPVNLSPDLWLDVVAGGYRYCICVEVNLSPVEQKRWRRTVRSYLHCMPAYTERFGTETICIAVIVGSRFDFPKQSLTSLTPSEIEDREEETIRTQKRFTDLLKWTEAELTALNLQQEADVFCFTNAPLATMSPEELFLSPHWVMPFHQSPESLILYGKEADTG